MQRRTFLQQTISSVAVGSPLISQSWRSAAPRAYLTELSRLMRAAPVPGAVIAVVENHKLAWVAPLGVLTEGAPAPVSESSLFEAASLTKPLVAYAAFALRAAGKLDFDRPLVEYLDDLPNPEARTVTARHVMSHTSGFVNWRSAAVDLAPAFKPGTKFQYSGEGFFYLQRVIERIHGSGIEQTLQDLVMRPLGMTRRH
jgi:CubicO group peptidase (beta-lactamase class C family)